jgi:hypothetical protein
MMLVLIQPRNKGSLLKETQGHSVHESRDMMAAIQHHLQCGIAAAQIGVRVVDQP